MMKRFILPLLIACSMASPALAQTPVTTDSRIKTYVYNENDVYNLLTYYGYQSNVEFGIDEKIQTVSIGDRVGWQLVPAGRRLFIRALSEDLHTNMTIITNERTYQFDLRSTNPAKLPMEELVYVVRFFYPDDKANAQPATTYPVPTPSVAPAPTAPIATPAPAPAPAPTSAPVSAPVAQAAPAPTPAPTIQTTPLAPIAQHVAAPASSPAPAPTTASAAPREYNYNYTYTGGSHLVPMGMFDDSHYTYLQFVQGAPIPEVFWVDRAGTAHAIQGQTHGDYYILPKVAPQFVLRLGTDQASLFNENLAGQ